MPERNPPGAPRPGSDPDIRPDPHRDLSTDPLTRLPHRGPARLPDQVAVWEPGQRLTAFRALDAADECLNEAGYLPTVLLVELMAQGGGLLIEDEGGPGGYGVIAGIKRMHLHDTARAGETVAVECRLVRRMGDLYMIECQARAGGGPLRGREIGHGTIQIRRVRGGAV